MLTRKQIMRQIRNRGKKSRAYGVANRRRRLRTAKAHFHGGITWR